MTDCGHAKWEHSSPTSRCWHGRQCRMKIGRYRTLSHQSYIDESLFGDSNGGKVDDSRRQNNSIESQSTLCQTQPVATASPYQDKQRRSVARLDSRQSQTKTVTARAAVHSTSWEPSIAETIVLPRDTFCRIMKAAGLLGRGATHDHSVAATGQTQTQAIHSS
ncbi:hypothetical protein BsWGS_28507 [Bradybaena similaris]